MHVKPKRIIAMVLCLISIFSMTSITMANEELIISEETREIIWANEPVETEATLKALKAETGWDYPVDVDNWNIGPDLGVQEWAKILEIPEDVLAVMPTGELVDLVLRYPFISSVLAYPTTAEGLEAVSNSCNGLRELLTRKDAPYYLMNAYKTRGFEIISADTANELQKEFMQDNPLPEDVKQRMQDRMDDALNGRKEMTEDMQFYVDHYDPEYGFYFDEDLTETNKPKVVAAILFSPQMEAPLEEFAGLKRLDSLDYRAFFRYEFDTRDEFSKSLEEILGEDNIDAMSQARAQYVYTPEGERVEVFAYNTYMPDRDKLEHANEARAYGGTVVLPATWDYNCHTFAWYDTTGGSSWWIDDPRPYYSGSRPSYEQDNGYYRPEDVCIWLMNRNYIPIHSGLVVKKSTTGQANAYYESKWREGCLVYHKGDRHKYTDARYVDNYFR